MNDRFQDLRTYVTVVQARGFVAASERLGLVKSAVSRRVRELEDRLGARLLHRTTRTLSLTDAGSEFYWRAVRILADLDEAEALAASGTQEAAGRVRVTAPVALVQRRLAPIAGELLQRFPRLVLEMHAGDQVEDLVGKGYDLALRVGDLADSSLVARRLMSLAYVQVATPAYLEAHGSPTCAEHLVEHRWIARAGADPASSDAPAGGHPGSARLVLADEEAIMRAVLSGYGVANLPFYVVAGAIGSGDLVHVMADAPIAYRALHAVYPSSRNLPTKVRTVVDFVVSRLADLRAP